ncbi:MAG: (Fe-S)-binding protein [Bacteroidales bacterium]|nr:(Fe-S)-binding protein [Bacteroidales bacterium]
MQFDPFVIPFNIGLYFIILYCVATCIVWFRDLSRTDKLRLQRGFFGRPFVWSIREIFMESLIHRKIIRINPVLGYMHMSLAFGWFLLIVLGTIEADIFGDSHLNPPYKAIFFRFFNPDHGAEGFARAYSFIMDLILAFILSGLMIAIIKRFWSRIVGMKKTTRLKTLDKIALTSLWLIFPSRLLAESLTCGAAGSGSFLTGSLGSFFAGFLPASQMAYPFWWLYSVSLAVFFILLPRTRYMHIPSELFLIFLRNSGVRTGDQHGSYTEAQVYSCSSCGICIDKCQLSSSAGINNIQSAYFVKGLKRNDDVYDISLNCLMCGRCETACPVGIELGALRMIQRRAGKAPEDMKMIWTGYMRERNQQISDKANNYIKAYKYLTSEIIDTSPDVLYFAGCMTHLIPGIASSMEKIFETAGVNYRFMDKDGSVCCGRPLMLAGKDREARELIQHNTSTIWSSGAKMLVTSCPICLRVFNESYHLDVEVLHHTQFISRMIGEERLDLKFLNQTVVYHDPCELGRGSGIYDEPRKVLYHIAKYQKTAFERENAPCCGGSLGNIRLDSRKKTIIASDALDDLTSSSPDYLITSCPLCKKTYGKVRKPDTPEILDIAEIVVRAISDSSRPEKLNNKKHQEEVIYLETK